MASLGIFIHLFSLMVWLCEASKDSLPFDSCSLCAKSNSSCRTVSGLFTRLTLPQGYNFITQLPEEACNLTVSQLKRTDNFLALRKSDGSFILNGDWEIGWSGDVKSSGMKFTYTRGDDNILEMIYSAGPLQETIDLMLIYQEPNLGVKYQYQFPMLRPEVMSNTLSPLSSSVGKYFPDDISENNEIEMQRPIDHFFSFAMKNKSYEPPELTLKAKHKVRRRKVSWKVVGFTECSKPCAGGVKTPVILCMREYNQMPVPEGRCAVHLKPLVPTLQCNIQPCAAQWVGGEWSDCSVSCGEGFQKRNLTCKQDVSPGLSLTVADDSCPTPASTLPTRKCNKPPCHEYRPIEPDWHVGPWSTCSVTCGMGFMNRTVHCPLNKCNSEHPPTHSVCDMGSCSSNEVHKNKHFWLFTEWSQQCSVSCGNGLQTRKVKCSGHHCDESSKPETLRHCFSDKQCHGQWYSGPWGQCSVQCGWGRQQRSNICISKRRGKIEVTKENHCLNQEKPTSEQDCFSNELCEAEWYTTEWSQCTGDCEQGVQTRHVQCLHNNQIPGNDCDGEKRPESQRGCSPTSCSQTNFDNTITGSHFDNVQFFSSFRHSNDNFVGGQHQPDNKQQVVSSDAASVVSTSTVQSSDAVEECEDLFHNCNLVTQARLCSYKYYNMSCCRSCRH